MKWIVLRRGGFEYRYRIGKHKAEMSRLINGDLDTWNNELTPADADHDVEELKRSSYSVVEYKKGRV